MEGVTILAVNEAVEAGGFDITVAILFLLLATVIGLAYGAAGKEPVLGTIVGACLGLIMGTFLGFATAEPASPETYKVTISDTVNFNEFNERYEIISQEGLIYTITEKTDEN